MRNFHAINCRCSVHPSAFEQMGLKKEDAIEHLLKEYSVEHVNFFDIIEHARSLCGTGIYELGAVRTQAPLVVDCSSFICYLFEQMGIDLPRWTVDQYSFGVYVASDFIKGDLLFTSGKQNFVKFPYQTNIGHVGIATGENSVIHASYSKKAKAICESSIEEFFSKERESRGGCRILDHLDDWLIFDVCPNDDIHWSDDLVSMLARGLPRVK